MADGSTIGARAKTKKKLIADLWCGAGGTITGAVREANKMGMPIDVISVNHWPTAIATHGLNYPGFRHHCADLESARPIELVPEGYLDALIASPTCTFHSRARGGKPVSDQQRMDPWHVVRWCTELRVKRIQIENVPEFMDWGPCSRVTGRPIASRKGEYFHAWLSALRAIGFRIDYRVICCADYGDATTRQRFFLIGRSDGKRLRWPEPTYARHASTDLLGSRLRWRGATEIIDWSLPGKSIFTRKKPLALNTLRRIHAGAVRYKWPQPYIDALQALMDGTEPMLDVPGSDVDPMLVHFRGIAAGQLQSSARSIQDPVPTITAGGGHVGMVMATASGGAAREVDEPVPTIVGGGNGASPHFITPLLVSKHGGPHNTSRPVSDPAWTVSTAGAGFLAEPMLAPYYGGGSGLTAQSVENPVPAVTTKARFGLIEPVLMRAGHGDSDGRDPVSRVLDLDSPIPGLTGSNEVSMATPFIVPITHSGIRPVHGIDEPLRTITCANRGELGLSQPFLVPNFSEDGQQQPRTHDIHDPLPTVTATGHIQLATPAANGYRIDILYRMLHWRELAGAMSFHDQGETYAFSGNNTEITKQIGNAVPCRTAGALFRALMEDA
jgi:DNA (cytosine-5)-methyltransferase 1